MLSSVILKPWQMYSPSRISHYRSPSNPAIQLIPLSKQAEYNPGKSTVQSHNTLPSIKVPNIFHLHLNLKLVRSLWDWGSYWICFSFPECSSLTRAKHRRTLPPKQKRVTSLGIMWLICRTGLESSEVHYLQTNLHTGFLLQVHPQ